MTSGRTGSGARKRHATPTVRRKPPPRLPPHGVGGDWRVDEENEGPAESG